MSLLEELNDKIKTELHLNESDSEYSEDEILDDEELEDDDDDSEDYDAEQDERKKSSRARIRVETESKIKGIIKNLDFEIDFRDLADAVNDKIDGVVLTREKSHELFNIVREFLNF